MDLNLQPSRQAALEYEGARLAPLVIDRRWIYRRVDVVTFHDDVHRTRSVTIDFKLPKDFAPVAKPRSSGNVHYVPVTLVGKSSPTNFDFVDDAGTNVPLLPAKERAALAAGVLTAMASTVLAPQAALAIRRDLRAIAGLDQAKSLDTLECLLRDSGPHAALGTSQVFRTVAQALAENYLAVLPLRADTADYRSVTFSYNERRERVFRRTTRSIFLRSRTAAKRSIGWLPKRVWLLTPSVGQGGTYHLRLRTPEGLKVPNGGLIPLAVDAHTGEAKPRAAIPARVDRAEPHVYVRDMPLASSGVAWFDVRARGRTVVRAAFMTALGTALLLGLGTLKVHDLVKPAHAGAVDAATALLLIVPSLAAAYVARSAEHLMVTSIVFGVRFLTLLSGFASFGAACVLAVGARGTVAQVAWDSFAALAILVLAALGRTVVSTQLAHQKAREWIAQKLGVPPRGS